MRRKECWDKALTPATNNMFNNAGFNAAGQRGASYQRRWAKWQKDNNINNYQ